MNYKKIIKAKGIKQRWLAQQLGVTDAMVSRVVNGTQKLSYEKEYLLKKLLS